MIKQEFTLDNYDWHITVFYAVHGYYVSDIMAKLHEIGISTDVANSIQHETMHLAIFISRAEGIELESEEVCYIGGEIAQKMHPKTKLLTSHCGCYTERIERKLYEK